MDNYFLAVGLFFLVINLISFFVMAFDKARSRKDGAERISEGFLFFMAAAFGSAGVYVGMLFFHHKNKKWYFLVGIPLVFLENISFLYLVYRYFSSIT